jgi:hypothetical protein
MLKPSGENVVFLDEVNRHEGVGLAARRGDSSAPMRTSAMASKRMWRKRSAS